MSTCTARAGVDQCELDTDHAGDHKTHWTPIVVLTWRGDEEWAHG